MFAALIGGVKNREDIQGDLLLGLGVSLLAVSIHSFEEYILVGYDAEYPLAVTIGLIAGLNLRLRQSPI